MSGHFMNTDLSLSDLNFFLKERLEILLKKYWYLKVNGIKLI